MDTIDARALEPLPGPELAARRSPRTWAVVLAGGEGRRLRPLVRRLFGDDRPKQYVPLLGPISLLRQTLVRIGRLIPPERTVVVSRLEHARYIAHELPDGPAPHVLLQPQDRGTAAAVLFAAHRIHQWDPAATIIVFPSDHFIREEDNFLAHVVRVAGFVARHPERMVLLGVRPTAPESAFGWINPGPPLGETSDGVIYRVHGFLEKPEPPMAQRCLSMGWLWNTAVFAATLPTLLNAGKQYLSEVDARFRLIGAFAQSRHEGWAIRQAYAQAPTQDFSRALLEQCPPFLAVSSLPRLTWSDLGTPRRVVGVASELPVRPLWMTAGRTTVSTLSTVLQEARD